MGKTAVDSVREIFEGHQFSYWKSFLFVIMVNLALWCIAKPLVVHFHYIPLVGMLLVKSMVFVASITIAFVAGTSLCCLVMAMVWLQQKPLYSVFLLIVSGLMICAMIGFGEAITYDQANAIVNPTPAEAISDRTADDATNPNSLI